MTIMKDDTVAFPSVYFMHGLTFCIYCGEYIFECYIDRGDEDNKVWRNHRLSSPHTGPCQNIKQGSKKHARSNMYNNLEDVRNVDGDRVKR